MRSSVILWWMLTGFFLLVAIVYTGWNILAHADVADVFHRIEWSGTVALFFSSFMGAMVSIYLSRTHKAQGGEAPADILTADIDDADPEYGEFSPWSWWPIVLAASAAISVIALSVGTWLLPVGLGVFVVAIIGWVYEYYRGNFAR